MTNPLLLEAMPERPPPDASAAGDETIEEPTRRGTDRQPLILVVDDTPETRRLMRRVLERDRFRVIEAATGEEALKAITRFRPALVVLDLRLPGIDGTEVARRVRAHPDPSIARTVLLACSASIQEEVRAAALEAGCDSFEGKPFNVATFAPKVRALISRRPAR